MQDKEQTAFLLVGGPMDGHVFAIPPNIRELVIPTYVRENIDYSKAEELLGGKHLNEYVYHKWMIHCGKRPEDHIHIFVYSELIDPQQFDTNTARKNITIELINHYRLIK